jgi:hypothetical protein
LTVRAAEGRYDAKKIIQEISENLIPKMESNGKTNALPQISFSNIPGSKKVSLKNFWQR